MRVSTVEPCGFKLQSLAGDDPELCVWHVREKLRICRAAHAAKEARGEGRSSSENGKQKEEAADKRGNGKAKDERDQGQAGENDEGSFGSFGSEQGGGSQKNTRPNPKPIIAELKPVPGFDADIMLPEVLGAWVMDEAERMPCPPDFIAAAALVALGSIVGARCAIKPKGSDSWLIVPNLWGGIVGNPSTKKSPAWDAALKPG